jgi:ribonucleoside-diphosphate reductase alpha chain
MHGQTRPVSTRTAQKKSFWKLLMVELNAQRTKVFLDRYAKKDENGQPVEKTVEQMWDRVAGAIGDTVSEANDFRKLLDNFKFVPGGRILAGAGVGTEQTFYNCYVIPVEPKESTRAANPKVGNDSREAIFDTIATMVDIMSRGGGVGINWSTLRPSGSYLSRVSGTSSGPVGWMDVASKAVGEVEQGGSRRGAAMFMIDDWHPDVLKFVEAKRDYEKITNANVSVAISDEFMAAVDSGADWQLRFPDTAHDDYNSEWDGDIAKWVESGRPVRVFDSRPAREIWDAIVGAAWASGEPGVVFLGRYNELSTGRHAERIIAVNPCGEQGLGAYSVCNLASFNLAAYVHEGQFKWEAFRDDIPSAVRFLDNVIDKSFYWDDRSKKRQEELRRIGLGVMGLADALILLGIRYGSEQAVKFTERVFQIMKEDSISASIDLAVNKGPAGAYVPEVWDRPYLASSEWKGIPLRNLFFLTQAPTGTTSILAGVNSGIEPYFSFAYTRKDRTGEHKVIADIVKQFDPAVKHDFLVIADDVTVEEHIAMQAAVQKYVDSSVSKTINGPESHTIEDVDKAYRLAYTSGLKGLAYFRNNSGRAQVLTREEPKVNALPVQSDPVGPPQASRVSRPKTLSGTTHRLNTSMGTLYLTINSDEAGSPVEVFVNVGKAGSDVMAMGEAIGRLVSLGLQSGIAPATISRQLVGVGGTSVFNPGLVHTIGKALEDSQVVYAKADPRPDAGTDAPLKKVANLTVNKHAQPGISASMCPDCGNFSVVREEGCSKCHNCGFSAC